MRDPAPLAVLVGTALDRGAALDLLPLVRLLPPDALTSVAAVVAARTDAELDALAAQASSAGQWEALLRLASAFDTETVGRLVRLPSFVSDDAVRAVLDAAAELDLWAATLPLAAALPRERHPAVLAAMAGLTTRQLRALGEAVVRSEHLPALVSITEEAVPPVRRRVAAAVRAAGRPDIADALVAGCS